MKNKLIIVVEDDQDLCESIIEILSENGFEAQGCETAEVALRTIKARRPSLIVVDNIMPGIGGMALIPILKREHPGIKIIMITAFSTVDNAVAAMKSGADDYLSKPFKRDELIVAVKRNLEVRRLEQQEAEPDIDETLACMANPIRRRILAILVKKREIRFMDLCRQLDIRDHTKMNFHLKSLKSLYLLSQDRDKTYRLTPRGEKMIESLALFSKRISF